MYLFTVMPPNQVDTNPVAAHAVVSPGWSVQPHGDEPEAKAHAYISGSPTGPMLECKLKEDWATNLTLAEPSPKVQNALEHSRTL